MMILVISLHSFSSLPKVADASPQILVDQFGYRPHDPKIAVIREDGNSRPKNTEDTNIFNVINVSTGESIYSDNVASWNQGKIHSQSGDIAWWFDFSSVSKPGRYIVSSQSGEKSFPFEIAEDVYRNILVAATRMYFYQRSGFAKRVPYADARWQDDAAFLGPQQDTEARFIDDKENPALARDMRGGWFDAGDTNKYVTFAEDPVHQLLHAYSQNPDVWTDNFNIPESGNGIPDLIDELRFELDWLQRMQDSDGGAFIKLGTTDYNSAERPSLDKRPRFYARKCSSATIAVASMFSHAALVLGRFPQLASYADGLGQKALKAWQWFESHPIETSCDSQVIKAGDADRTAQEQIGEAVAAAVYLFALTENPKYTNYIKEHLSQTQPFLATVWSSYQVTQGDALLFYAKLPSANAALRELITNRFKELVRTNVSAYGNADDLDPYQAYMPDEQYHWGSNFVKANYGNTNYDVVLHNINPNKNEQYRVRALNSLHYFHGVNPLGIVYLTNMYDYGAEYSANEMWHEWLGKGIYSNALTSPSGPAPGYVTGGPNKDSTGSATLRQQPPMKAYLDSHDVKLNMWEVTEPSIVYQAAYIKLLSKFVDN
ncbi:MAG: glycoside hydrolase family 9 protein [Tolypothrix sp. T3-bin4]|nr:glycoside hydrolase family 9 protein [Tolypothrix sp. T3-bin4]